MPIKMIMVERNIATIPKRGDDGKKHDHGYAATLKE
jgi:hypothetical protein